ncbi:hypothetical protein MCOR02_010962 [Pyricularia oryzae]|uniref:RING-type domain-containing protein n=4 Tax=Pyricularia TaxID=48558 RepID=A0ABQ8NR25_PYRGI|nr:hypothetical protein OOU_Y34scaffold00464g107 [Pyricularia oryzae Y34]KAH9428409.1 hypothetical protein MCOR02_010962 [Pyricularia oryzae]KAI6300884.1 hypothetical protein MCOR33_003509 [Pyricularia grisea]KAI6259972.1 hypothetical protein MCOR19_003696 [Pyricularia oryzae]KAI6285498.1 hypothetical protein MCOR26_001474 [Pyricularia oryzae]
MSGTGSRQPLDASAGRDVVYCHACENEWFQDQNGLVCPQCHSEATEIVTPENDPRPVNTHDSRTEPQGHRDRYDDSDPEEEDIEEHSHRAPGGIYFTSRVFRMPVNHGAGTESPHVHPSDGNAVMERFYEMMNRDMGSSAAPGASNSDGTRSATGQGASENSGTRHYTTRTTMFPGGSTSFTITTAPLQRDGNNPPIGEFDAYADPHPRTRRRIVIVMLDSRGADSNASILSTIMGNITNPVGNTPHRGGETSSNDEASGLPPHGFPIAFQQLLGALMTGYGGTRNWGDVVTSQEEFDRIISQMMEANPMSNAAPPASEAAIEKLERKKLDEKMLGTDETVECTICMDDLSLGDEATVLPCKHFFHGECVTIWLKEHNTCPICRTPMEQRSSAERTQAPQNQSSSGPRAARPEPPRGIFPWAFQPSGSGTGSFVNSSSQRPSQSSQQSPIDIQQNDSGHTSHRRELLRSPSTNEERLRAIRDLANSDRHGGSDRPTTPPFAGRRRNSLSPPSPSMQAPWNLSYDPVHDFTSASRDRTRERDGDRSNSQSSSRFTSTNRDQEGHRDRERYRQQTYESSQPPSREQRDQERNDDNGSRRGDPNQTSSGSTFDPFSWIRDRLPGGGNSSGDSHRRG